MKNHRSPTSFVPKEFAQNAATALNRWAAPLDGLNVALLVTPDGFEISSIVQAEMNLTRLGAMTSSLIAMTRAVGRELHFSSCRRLVIDTEQGSVIVQPIDGKFPCLLCVVMKSDAVLGSALWSMGEIARSLSCVK